MVPTWVWFCGTARSEVLRFRPPQSPTPGFADAFEEYFGRAYDEEEADAVYATVGQGAPLFLGGTTNQEAALSIEAALEDGTVGSNPGIYVYTDP